MAERNMHPALRRHYQASSICDTDVESWLWRPFETACTKRRSKPWTTPIESCVRTFTSINRGYCITEQVITAALDTGREISGCVKFDAFTAKKLRSLYAGQEHRFPVLVAYPM